MFFSAVLHRPTVGSPVPLSLSQAAAGTVVRITGVAAGSRLERRLHELGLPRGTEVRVVQHLGRRGATVVMAHGSRLAVGAGVASRIEVMPVPEA